MDFLDFMAELIEWRRLEIDIENGKEFTLTELCNFGKKGLPLMMYIAKSVSKYKKDYKKTPEDLVMEASFVKE